VSDEHLSFEENDDDDLRSGQLLRGFTKTDQNSLLASNDREFFIPSTRNETVIAMERLFRLLSDSNQLQSGDNDQRAPAAFRIGFLPDAKTKEIRAFLFTVNMNVTFNSFAVQDAYYNNLQTYFEKRLEQLKLAEGPNGHVYRQVKHG
jgi:hypothetical protein